MDKISIAESIRVDEFCPKCQEQDIINLMDELVLEEDLEEAVAHACEISKDCKECHLDELDDLTRM